MIFKTNNNNIATGDKNILFNKINARIGAQKIILAHIANKIWVLQRKNAL